MNIQYRIASLAAAIGLLVLPLRPAFGESAAIHIWFQTASRRLLTRSGLSGRGRPDIRWRSSTERPRR